MFNVYCLKVVKLKLKSFYIIFVFFFLFQQNYYEIANCWRHFYKYVHIRLYVYYGRDSNEYETSLFIVKIFYTDIRNANLKFLFFPQCF